MDKIITEYVSCLYHWLITNGARCTMIMIAMGCDA